MEKKIPYSQLDSFGKFYLEDATAAPGRHAEQVRRKSTSYFSIFERTVHPCKTEININRSDFYKILLITEGTGIFHYGTKEYEIGPDTILFIKPTEVKSWQATSEEQGGYYCIFSEEFLAITPRHLRELRSSQLFDSGNSPVQMLNQGQKN